MKKAFTIVLIMSFLFILASFYVNYYYEDLYVLDFDNYDEVMVNSNYVNERINLCYGTKHTCKNINYKINGKPKRRKIIETPHCFTTLRKNLPIWINNQLKKQKNKTNTIDK